MTKKKTQKKKKKRRFYVALLLLIIIFLIFATSGIIYVLTIIKQLPPLEQFSSRKVSQSTKIYDRTGEVLLYEIFGEEKRTIVPFEEIPENLKRATLVIEDTNFYNQPAFDWKAIIRAFIANLREGEIVQGGSTITQQLVKNVFLTPKQTIDRKIRELILAIELESKYSKDEIFSAYLNQISYGSNTYGVESASQTFFGKSVRDLNLSEMTTLASLPKAPSYYSPWGDHLDELINRRDHVLDKMYKSGFITETEKQKALNQELYFSPPSLGIIKAPHFSLMVKNYLINKYGEDLALNGGLKVTTTLDWEIQQIAQDVIEEGTEINARLYDGKNAALVAQDSETGQILALVGSRDYFDKTVDGNFNVAAQGLRQPGSALKPFVYLTAFKKGYSPKTIIYDTPTEFVSGDPNCPSKITLQSEVNDDCFNPDNFDERFRGSVSMEEALSQSINVPSVKTLYLAGFSDVLKTLSDFGISTLKERWRYGLSLVLGGGEVKLTELVNAYATLAEEGEKHEQSLILKIEKPNGDVVEEFKDRSERVFDAQLVKKINWILSDKQLRSGLFQSSLNMTLFPGHEVALKTGTTNNYRDAWSIGYTPYLTVGVWAGNNNNTPMHRHGSSILAAVPMWSNFLNRVFEIKEFPNEVFGRSEPQSSTNKPMLNGYSIFSPVINNNIYPQIHSILYWVNKDKPLDPPPAQPGQDPQFSNWETAVLEWARDNIPDFYKYNQLLPQNVSFENTVKIENLSIQFKKPQSGSYLKRPFLVQANINSLDGLENIEFYFNNQLIQNLNISGNTYTFFYYLNQPLTPQNSLELRVADKNGNQKRKSIIIFRE